MKYRYLGATGLVTVGINKRLFLKNGAVIDSEIALTNNFKPLDINDSSDVAYINNLESKKEEIKKKVKGCDCKQEKEQEEELQKEENPKKRRGRKKKTKKQGGKK
jgi:hypothetical protein